MMIQFDKPTNLNGSELLAELNANGVAITEPPLLDGNGNFWLDIKPADEAKAAAVVAAHNGTTVAPQPTIEDKLSSVGLSLPDLKVALGL
jgi:Ser/Thr protein kinase RdoA (MazF antagonist)